METTVQSFDGADFADMFSGVAGGQADQRLAKPGFGMQDGDNDILNIVPPVIPSTTETTTLAPVEGEGAAPTEGGEADILGTPAKDTPKPLGDLSGYYKDRIENGFFVRINDDKGEPFIPKTAEEYDEVIQLQIDHRLSEARADLEKKWYDSKSPAWKVISQYADQVDDPTQLIPFLQGVKTYQSVASLDDTQIDGAEQIVRMRLEQRGDPEDIIASQIEALKTTDKLISTAKQYKPIILQQEQKSLMEQQRAADLQTQQYMQVVGEIRESALKEIEKPFLGKVKLKNEEKAAIYDLIAEPSQETQGYGIYTAIDKLFDAKDFDTLKQVALLLSKKDSFYNYLGTSIANQTASDLQRKLQVAAEARKASGNDFDEERIRNTIQRNPLKKTTFGRG